MSEDATQSCDECPSLVCIIRRSQRRSVIAQIEYALNPEPSPDATEVVCAACATVLWEWGEEE